MFSLADETFYGGSAGGGKSDLAIGLAVEEHERSLIFRRHYKDLSWLEERTKQIIGGKGLYNGQAHTWRLTKTKVITFGALQRDADWEKYQGKPHDLLVFDELTHFSQRVFQTLMAWNRTTTPGQRCRVLATFNPPMTVEGEWVLKYLAPWFDENHPNPAAPGEIRWFATIDGVSTEVASGEPFEHTTPSGIVEIIQPRSRTFIPAKLTDNAFLGADYRATLQSMPEPMRSQLLYGDMKAGQKDDAWQVFPTAWIKAAQERWKAGRPKDEKGELVPLRAIGVDVALGGDDTTTIATMYGEWIDEISVTPGSETPDGYVIAEMVKKIWTDGARIAIDKNGVGASPYNILQKEDLPILGVFPQAGTKARSSEGNLPFANMRSELFWKLREALDPKGPTPLALPPDPALEVELRAHRWFPTAQGIRIEEKDAVIKRIGRSPDRADAVTLVWKAARQPGFL